MTIGLTGGIGSGKSIVAAVVETMGYPVFYSDRAAKALMISNTQVRETLIQHFGNEVYQNGSLNRELIAQRIFSHPEEKETINALIHPLVRKAFREFVQKQSQALVFNEAAILFETGGDAHVDKTILVTAPLDLRIKRVMKRDSCTKEMLEMRMNNQWTDEAKFPLADFVLVNDDVQPLLIQIEQLLDDLLRYSTSS